MPTLGTFIRQASENYVNIAGVFIARPVEFEEGTSKKGTPYVRIKYLVDECLVAGEGEGTADEQVGRVINDFVYFTPNAVNRALLISSALQMFTDAEKQNVKFENSEKGREDLNRFLYQSYLRRLPQIIDSGIRVRLTTELEEPRTQQVYNQETGEIETRTLPRRARVTFSGVEAVQWSPTGEEEVDIEAPPPLEL